MQNYHLTVSKHETYHRFFIYEINFQKKRIHSPQQHTKEAGEQTTCLFVNSPFLSSNGPHLLLRIEQHLYLLRRQSTVIAAEIVELAVEF